MKKCRLSIKLYAATLALLLNSFFVHAQGAASSIVITEVAAFETSPREWIKIKNIGIGQIDLTSWKFFEDGTNHGLSLFRGSSTLAPGSEAVIANKAPEFAAKYASYTGTIFDSSWGSLKESGEEIGLKDAQGNLVDTYSYPPSTNESPVIREFLIGPEAQTTLQPGLEQMPAQPEKGILPPPRPEEDPQLSGAKQAHDDKGPLPKEGSPKVSIGMDPKPIFLHIHGFISMDESRPMPGRFPSESEARASKTSSVDGGDLVKITELYPNPGDGEEWIEIANFGNTAINLDGWLLSDSSKLDSPFVIPAHKIEPNSYLVFQKSKTKISLNNGNDTVTLADPNGTPVDAVTYKNSKKGKSYARADDSWQWTDKITPGAPNPAPAQLKGTVSYIERGEDGKDAILQIKNNKRTKKVKIRRDALDPTIAMAMMPDGSRVELEATKINSDEEVYELDRISSVSKPAEENKERVPSHPMLWLFAGASAAILYFKLPQLLRNKV